MLAGKCAKFALEKSVSIEFWNKCKTNMIFNQSCLPKSRCGCFLHCNCNGCNLMIMGSSLKSRKYSIIDAIFVIIKNVLASFIIHTFQTWRKDLLFQYKKTTCLCSRVYDIIEWIVKKIKAKTNRSFLARWQYKKWSPIY